MNEKLKDIERFEKLDIYRTRGLELENAFKPTPANTSDEAIAEWRKREEEIKIYKHTQKIYRLARPIVTYSSSYRLLSIKTLNC